MISVHPAGVQWAYCPHKKTRSARVPLALFLLLNYLADTNWTGDDDMIFVALLSLSRNLIYGYRYNYTYLELRSTWYEASREKNGNMTVVFFTQMYFFPRHGSMVSILMSFNWGRGLSRWPIIIIVIITFYIVDQLHIHINIYVYVYRMAHNSVWPKRKSMHIDAFNHPQRTFSSSPIHLATQELCRHL